MNWTVGMTGILRPLNELEIDFEGAKLRGYAKFSAPGTSQQVIVSSDSLRHFDGKTQVKVKRIAGVYMSVELPDGREMQAFPHFLMENSSTKPIDGIRKIRI